MKQTNPRQAAHTAEIIRAAGHNDVCSICGDTHCRDYQSSTDANFTIRLCDTCRKLQNELHGLTVDAIT